MVEGDAASDTGILRDNGAGTINVGATGNPNLNFAGIKNISWFELYASATTACTTTCP